MGYYTDYTLTWDGADDPAPSLEDQVDAAMAAGASASDIVAITQGYEEPGDLDERIAKALIQISEYSFERHDGGLVIYDSKWYDYNTNMIVLSRAFPKLTFTLHGNGEERGDVWMQKYRNGDTSDKVKATMIFEFPEDWK